MKKQDCWDVYRVICHPTGKSYIGISRNGVQARWKDHLSEARRVARYGSYLHRAIRKYGEAAFSVEALYQAVDFREAQACEKALIGSYRTFAPFGMNVTTGGEGAPNLKRSAATIEKLRKASLGRPQSKETRDKRGASLRGKKHSTESIENMKRAQSNRSESTRKKISDAARKAWAKQGVRERHSQVAVAAWQHPATREKNIAGLRASWTPERKAKASVCAKLQRQREASVRRRPIEGHAVPTVT